MNEHVHDWTWRWFGVRDLGRVAGRVDHELVGLRTCGCGAFEHVEPNQGYTGIQEARRAALEAEQERKRARTRAYNAARKAKREASA